MDAVETDFSADTGEHQFTLEQSSTYNEPVAINDTVNTLVHYLMKLMVII